MTCFVGHRRTGVLATVLAVLAGVLAAAPAQAAEPPEVTSISVSATSVTAPGKVTVSFTATGADPVQDAWAVFAGPRGSAGRVDMIPTDPGTGSGVLTVPDFAESGTLRLQWVTVRTSPQVLTRVCSTEYAKTATQTCTRTADFSAYDIVVRGATPEYAAPKLASASLSPVAPTVVTPTTPVTVAWALATPAADLVSVEATVTDRATRTSAKTLMTRDLGRLQAGRFSAYVDGVPSGDYVLRDLTLCDRIGNCATYLSDGTVTLSGGARTPTSATVQLTGVIKVFADHTPPALTSLQLAASTISVSSGVRATYAVKDDAPRLESLALRYTALDPETSDFEVSGFDVPLTGTLTRATESIGRYRLDVVTVSDGQTSVLGYRRDGTIEDLRFGTVVGHHEFDLASMDLRIVPRAPKITARPFPHGAKITFGWVAGNETATGYEIVAEPGHHVRKLTGPNIYTGVIDGLTAGTTYTVSVRALSPAGPGPATTFTTTPLLTASVVGVGDLSKDGRGDLVAFERDRAYTRGYWGNGKGGISGGGHNIADVVPASRIIPAGDMNGDGRPDLLADHGGRLQLYRGSTGGFLTDPLLVGTGWAGMRFITGGGDFSGDGRADVLVVDARGRLNLYAGNGRGKVLAGRTIGTGWGSFVAVFTTADFNGDRTRDVLAIDRAGALWLYPGNGKGGFRGTRTKAGSGWAGLAMAGPVGDFTGDGRADVLAATNDGKLRVYAGDGRGHLSSARTVGTGWRRYF